MDIILCKNNLFNDTLKDIENKFLFDLKTIYIIEENSPVHSTIGDFANTYIELYQYKIFTYINLKIKELLNEIEYKY